MCYFKRLIYTTCSHALFLGPDPVRKCHLQLAYEAGETDVPCGKMWLHSYTSLKVDGLACHKCRRTAGTLSRIRSQLRDMRLRLNVDVDGPAVPAVPAPARLGEGGGGGGERGRRRERGGGGGGGSGEKGGWERGERRGGGEEEEYGYESLSPVELGFGSVSGGGGSEEEDGDVSSMSLDGAPLSAVGYGD